MVVGRFCSVCGEKLLTPEDHTLKHYLGALLNAFTFADSKLWNTLKAVVLRPGELSAAYMDGRRVKYMRPVAFFFLANFIYFLLPLFETFNTSLHTQVEFQVYSSWVKPMVSSHLASTGMDMEAFRAIYEPASTSNAKLLLVLMVGLLSAPIALVFARRSAYFSAYVTAAFEMMSFHLWASTILLGLVMYALIRSLSAFGIHAEHLTQDGYMAIVVLVFHFHVTIGLARRAFHCTTPGSIWRAVFMVAGLEFALTGYRLALFLATFAQVT